MIPTRLNFLPKEKQRYLHRAIIGEFAKSIVESFLLVAAVCAIALLAGESILDDYFRGLAENSIAVEQQHTQGNQQIRDANKIIRDAWAVEQTSVDWAPVIAQISNAIPDGIALQQMTFDNTTHQLTLSGKAQTRETLLALEQSLRQVPFVISLTIPLSDLTQKTDIAFSLSSISITPL